MTIVQTIVTQVQMRSLSLLSLLLIAIWSLSPLGGQASLRIIHPLIHHNITTRPLEYANTNAKILTYGYGSDDTDSMFTPTNVLFGAAMLGITSSSSHYVDSWNNLKVPWIEYLDPSTADVDGWYPVPKLLQLNSSDDFTSLIGIPLSTISSASNLTTSFNIETSYWTLSCPVFEDLGDDLDVDALNRTEAPSYAYPPLGNATDDQPKNLLLFSVNTYNSSEPRDPTANTRLRRITYVDYNNGPAYNVGPGSLVTANCTIKTSYVEVSASCLSGSCTAVRIRNSHKPHAPESWDII